MTDEINTEQYEKMAQLFLKEKRYPEAIAVYRELVSMKPENESFKLCLAWAYKDNGQTDEAVACFEKIFQKELQRKTFTGFAYDELVRLFRDTGEYDRLVETCEKAAAAQPEDTALLYTLGDAYLRAGKVEKSIEVFSRLTAEEPDSSHYLSSLGNALIAAGRFDEAEESYAGAIENDFPGKAALFYNKMGHAFYRAGVYDRAEKAQRNAVRKEGNEPVFHCDLGDILVAAGRIEEARTSYEEAARINPSFKGSYFNRFGNILLKEKQYIPAIEAFKKAVEADPENGFYRLHLAEAYGSAGLTEEAKKILERFTTPEEDA